MHLNSLNKTLYKSILFSLLIFNIIYSQKNIRVNKTDLDNGLKILSYNIRYDNPDDGINKWDNRKGTIINYIKKNTPDIIGMQEVLNNQLIELDSSLDDYAFVGVGREDGKTKGEYSPIFFKPSKLILIKSDTFWLSETPDKVSVGWDAALERICTYALFEQINTKKKFLVFNTHFDHIGENARSESAKLILKKIKKINRNKLPTLITGDFNLTPETKPMKIFKNNFNDVMESSDFENTYNGTYTGFNVNENPTRRIDYIFEKDFQVKKAKHLLIKTSKGLWASDHHPVFLSCYL